MNSQVPTIKLNFSGSNASSRNSISALEQARATLSNMSNRRLKREESEAAQKRFDRQQTFLESADEREIAAEQAKYNLQLKRNSDNHALGKSVIDDISANFSPDENNLKALRQDPRYISLNDEQKARLESDFVQGMKENINLHADPALIASRTRELARSRGLSDEVTERLVSNNLESFNTIGNDQANLTIEQNNSNQSQIADLLSKFSGNSRSGAGSSNSGASKTNSSDSNIRSNSEFLTQYLDSIGANQGQASLLTRGLDAVNPLNDTDVTRANLTPLLSAMEELGVRAPSAIKALEGNRIIIDGEYQGETPENILSDPNKLSSLIESARIIQNSGNSTGSTSQTTSSPSLSDSLQLLRASQQDNANANARVNSQRSPRQRSLSDRRQVMFDLLEEQTGVSLKNLNKPTEKQLKKIKDTFIPVEQENTIISEVTDENVKNETNENTDNLLSEDKDEFEEITKRGNLANPTLKVFQKGTKENKAAFKKLRETRNKERKLEKQQLQETISTIKILIERNKDNPDKLFRLEQKLKQLELK